MTEVTDFISAYNPILRGDVNPEDWSKKIRVRAPETPRPKEVREGGFIVVERTRKKRLLRPAAWPVETGSMKEAVAAVKSLQARFPQKTFCIFQQVAISEGNG